MAAQVTALRKILIIPHWVVNTFRRVGEPLANIVDVAKLEQYCSPVDVAQMLSLNMGASLDTLGLSIDNTPIEMLKNCGEDGECVFFENVLSLLATPYIVEGAMNRVYAEEAIDSHYTKPFVIHDLGRDVIGVVIHPGYFIANTTTLGDVMEREQRQYELLRGILTALYVQAPYHVLASSSLYQRYLSLLSKKRII